MATARASTLQTPRARIEAALARPGTLALAKTGVFLLALYPAADLLWQVFFDPFALGANPAETIIRALGDWTLQFLLITLAITPLRRLTGLNSFIKFRRMLGLFAFFYGVIHLLAYLAFDRYFIGSEIVADIIKRPFITVGMAAMILMTPLAITSTKGFIRRLGAARWNQLHRLIYPIAVLGVLHYWWLVKRDLTWPVIYALILVLLLGYRVIAGRRTGAKKLRAAKA
jgi:sulfoxide reductase heme-binding subunit YedZ